MAGDGLDAGARRDIEALIELLKAEDRRSLRGMTETELIRLHHGYGTWLRNQFRRNKFSDPFRFCDAKTTPDTRSFDTISGMAIREIWCHLRSGVPTANPKQLSIIGESVDNCRDG
jgi:hypothetical protein